MQSMTNEEMATLPHIVFFNEAVEDREATIKEGKFIARDVAMVKITARGTKDNVLKAVDDWFESLKGLLMANRLSPAAYANYQEAFEMWKKGEEIPEKGTSVKNWPVASPAQVKTLLSLHVFTVEQLANANEQIISALGLHGRLLHQRAQAYLKEAKDVGSHVLLVEKLQMENASLKDTVEDLLKQLTEARAQIPLPLAKTPFLKKD